MSDIETRMDILYGKINALEIVLEEVFAHVLQEAKEPMKALELIGGRAKREAEHYRKSNQLGARVSMETEDSVKRIIGHLSIALAGSKERRSRGA